MRSVTRAVKYINEHDSDTVAGYLVKYFDGTSKNSLKVSVDSYKKIDAWVTDMAMKESAFEKLQDIIYDAGELESRVKFSDLVTTGLAHSIYEEVYA